MQSGFNVISLYIEITSLVFERTYMYFSLQLRYGNSGLEFISPCIVRYTHTV